MDVLIQRHQQLLRQTDLGFERFLINELPWNERLIGIKGSRGVGKTTMLLQYIQKNYGFKEEALYLSLDDLYFSENTLSEVAKMFVQRGGKHLFLDEVHKYPNWSIELKNLYDFYSDLRIVFTGSSLLEILNSRSDLSRRALVYQLPGLSYREFLNINFDVDFPKVEFQEMIKNHPKIATDILKEIRPIQHFSNYLKFGYFPFYQENEHIYYKRIQEILNMIIEIELPQLRSADIHLVPKIKQLVYVLSQTVPFKPNITKLAERIQVSRKTILEQLNYLNDAGILQLLNKNAFGISALQKPDKIYLENTNFMFAINPEKPNIGSLRETFFLNQIKQNNRVSYPEKGDFFVNEKYLFEVGGSNKTQKQISGIKDSFLVKDDLEIGFDNQIPLWLFGFLY